LVILILPGHRPPALARPFVKGLLKNGVSGFNPALCGYDGFVNSPISALRFSALSLRRTGSTPHSTHFARLELGLFTKPSLRMTFYGFINFLN